MKKQVTFTLDEELIKELKQVSADTLIPQSQLVAKAIRELLERYE